MNLTIVTTKHSKESAKVLGEALDCPVYNPYEELWYKGVINTDPIRYNMGCAGYEEYPLVFNHHEQIATCIHKIHTLEKLRLKGVLTVPYTRDIRKAQEWLDEDTVVVNRERITGKANEGLHYSFKNAERYEDTPLVPLSKFWTRHVNHDQELRAYCIAGKDPIVLHKENAGGYWSFHKVGHPEQKLLDQLALASRAFNKMFTVAYDILHAKTGDYYFLEANSAPSLLVHPILIPTLSSAIKEKLNATRHS